MHVELPEWKPSERDVVISRVQLGEMTPEEAEAEANAKGWEPFQWQPPLPAFDPMLESRWSLVMAIIWIAWRDPASVREYWADFREECTHWFFREWRQPAGDKFLSKQGSFLERWPIVTVPWLSTIEQGWHRQSALPATWQMTVREAEQTLWRALEEGHLVGEALGPDGRPVQVPAHEWSYLKLYEERERDVLKYDLGDRQAAFTDVKFRRIDLHRLWPPIPADGSVEAPAIAANADDSKAGPAQHIAFAWDERTRTVVFQHGIELGDSDYDLFAALRPQFEADLNACASKDRYQFVKASALAESLHIEEPSLRKRVSRTRRRLKQEFHAATGRSLNSDDVIQSQGWKGYRLNPAMLLVLPAQLRRQQTSQVTV